VIDDAPDKPITPKTRRMIIIALAVIAVISIMAELVLAWIGKDSSDALMTVAATCVGALGGAIIPPGDNSD
jgi:hypothetical protein